MDVFFVNELCGNIYSAKVNGIIPWAIVQTDTWAGGDPNPGTAFRVDGEGDYSVEKGYYSYKQVCRAGQRGMAVASTRSNDPAITLMAFASNGTRHPSAFLVLNLAEESKEVDIDIEGLGASQLEAYRTGPEENYVALDKFNLQDPMTYDVPGHSVTTFYAA
jgi:hypothetical protein